MRDMRPPGARHLLRQALHLARSCAAASRLLAQCLQLVLQGFEADLAARPGRAP
jgi:hypothetical protein